MTDSDDLTVIRARGLSRSFGRLTAVAALDLDVRRGEMFGLVGPDAAGKSTAIRLLCGILKPTGGEARVLGFDLAREPERIKSRIGYLSQSFTLYGDLTVDENIEFFAEIHGVRDFRARRDELLAFTRLAPFRTRLADALSGGMKKKLALGCTLIHRPQLLFLDEPSTGVDPVSRGEFWNILSDILADGVTVVMTTPYLDEAERCHRVGLMHHGRLLATGTPADIRQSLPGKLYRVEGVDRRAAYEALRNKWPSAQVVLYGDRLHFWAPKGGADRAEVLAWLSQQVAGTADLVETAPSLEDVFVAQLGE